MYTCVSHFLDAQVETCQKRKVTMLLLLLLMMMMMVVVVLWWCCCEGVVLIVMREDGDGEIYHDKVCWQQLFGKKPFTGPFGRVVSVVLVSWWLVNFVSVVVGVLVALWWCVRSVLTVSGDVLGVLLMFWVFLWCHGSVPVVSWWYWRSGILSTKLAHLSTQNWRQWKRKTLVLGFYAELISVKRPRKGGDKKWLAQLVACREFSMPPF